MPLWKCILTYDGTPYNGWQIQPSLPTVQGTFAAAIHHVTGERVLPQGSGRTDTGVHALAQVASFSLTVPIPASNLQRALNRALPHSIRVLLIEEAEPGFHARHSARRKTYEYRIFPRLRDQAESICSPMLAPFVWDCPWPLSLGLLERAAPQILGEHNFTTFAAVDPDITTRIRMISNLPPSVEGRHSERSEESPNFAANGSHCDRQRTQKNPTTDTFTPLRGANATASISTASPDPAFCTTWCATSSAPSWTLAHSVFRPMPYRHFSQQMIALPQVQPRPPEDFFW